MKNLFLIFLLIATATASYGQFTPFDNQVLAANQTKPASGGGVVFPSGSIADWQLNNNANDSSGNGQNGTLQGSPTVTTGQNSLVNGAFILNGTSQYVQGTAIANGPALLSASVWFKTTSANNSGAQGYGALLSNISSGGADGSATSGEGWLLFMNGGVFDTEAPAGAIEVLIQDSGAVNWKQLATTVAFNDGNWHNAAFTYNQSSQTLILYIDGSVATTANESSGTPASYSNAGNVLIGNDASNQYFNGDIDEASVWSRILTSTEIGNINTLNAR